MSKTWLRTADPSILERYAGEWEQIGTSLEGLYQKYVDDVSKVNGQYWDGKAATAAQDRANGDLKAVQTLVDKLDGLAGQARTGASLISEALRKARGLLDECTNKCWAVSENLTVTGSGDARAVAQMNKDLVAAYNAAVAADLAVYDTLNLARSSLSVVFTSGASLGGAQGKDDGKRLITDPSNLPEAELQRIIDAGTLTDDQLTALRNGENVTIPVAQMDYINQLARSMDDKSPQEIQAIMNKLPPNAKTALANSLQLASTGNVTTATKGDPTVPDHGGESLLPKKIQQSLDRSDLVEDSVDPLVGRITRLNGVADNQAIAKIAGTSDPSYRVGSDLDKKVLDVSAQYLHAQTTWEQDSQNTGIGFTVDGTGFDPHGRLTEDMFRAVADDKAAVQDLVVSADSKPNDQFFQDVLTHQWKDQGDAVSSLFSFGDGPTPANHQTPIMNAFAQFTASDNVPGQYAGGDDKYHLYNIPGADGKSVGELNPKLLQTLSTSMTPYVNDLTIKAGVLDDGFKVTYRGEDGLNHSWTSPTADTFTGAKNIFSLFDTDDTAGKQFNGAALAASLEHEIDYGQNRDDPNAQANLKSAGRLQGLVDAGMRDELSADGITGDEVAKEAYEKKAQTYDLVKAALGVDMPIGKDDMKVDIKIPGGEQLSQVVELGGDPLKEAIIGAEPTPSNNAIGLSPPSFNEQSYNVLANTEVPDNLRQKYSDLFDDSGHIKPWKDIESMPVNSRTGTNPADNFSALFSELSPKDGNAIRDGYGDVTGYYRQDDKQEHK